MKYLFKALFDNGEIYEQSPGDQSILNPTKSCFFDVLEKQKTNKLIAFSLNNPATNEEYLVDLRNGEFEINGSRFRLHDEEELTDFRIIYFRRNTLLFTQNLQKTSHTIEYCFGWQSTHNNQNYKKIIHLT